MILGFAITHCCASAALAQTPVVVQLPAFHYFTTNTSVLAPDGGDAFLGGFNAAAAGNSQRGIPGLPSRPFTNNATGSSTGAGNVSVSVQIHDFDVMEEALIGPPTPQTGSAASLLAVRQSPVPSVAALKAQQAAEAAAGDQQATADLERGRQLLAQHRFGVAKLYFQSAASQSGAASDVHRQAIKELTDIQQKLGAAKIAGQ
ncbi:MAG TPA: hypothetical protein VMJ32_15610 [Pirellulales bacterium]|nr:hypothetical protein [Pirellulales bacterium]